MKLTPRYWLMVATPALLILAAALVFAQIDLTGYWAFRVKDGGVNYFQLQQSGQNVTTVATAGRGGGRGGRGLSGTLQNGRLHLVSTFTAPGPPPAAAAAGGNPAPPAQTRETVY